MRLQLKVFFGIFAIMVLLGGLGALGMLYLQRKASADQFQRIATALVMGLQAALEHEMLEGRQDHVQDAISRMSRGQMVNEVVIYSPTGKIFASGAESEIGQMRDDADVREAVRSGMTRIRFEERYGRSELCVVSPVFNQPACQGCHGSEAKVLGAIEVGLKTAFLDELLGQHTLIIVLAGGLTILIVGGAVSLLLRRTVLDRLSSLVLSARRISQGDYAARVGGDQRDELGVLGQTFNEMAERVEQHAIELKDRVEQRTRELSSLLESSSAFASTLDLDLLLQKVMEKMTTMAGPAEAGALFLYDEDGARLRAKASFGCDEAFLSQGTLTLGEALADRVFASRRPIILPKAEDVVEAIGDKGVLACCEPQNAVGIPLLTRDVALGSLVLLNVPDPGACNVQLLQAFGHQIAVAVENARLYQELETKERLRGQLLERIISAQEEERKRIARELHDEAGQALSAAIMGIASAVGKLPPEMKEARESLLNARAVTAEALAEVRKLIHDLRPEILDDLGLVPALRWYVKNRLENLGIKTRLQFSGTEKRLPAQVEVTLFRVVQEAITNIARHAEATRARVSLEVKDSMLTALIEDNGRGFDSEKVLRAKETLGLRGMEERLALIGGQLRIESAVGRGTKLRVTIPLEEQENG